MGWMELDNGKGSQLNDQEDYETSNNGERDTKSNPNGGKDGEKLSRAMNRKYPEKRIRGKEHR